QTVVAHQIDLHEFAGEQTLAALENLVEYRRRVGDGAADRGENLTRRALLLERFLSLVEQAHILDRDRRLVAEGLQQGDFPLIEGPYLLTAQQDRAKGFAFAKQRHHDDRAVPGALRNLETERVLSRRSLHIGNLDCHSLEQRAA